MALAPISVVYTRCVTCYFFFFLGYHTPPQIIFSYSPTSTRPHSLLPYRRDGSLYARLTFSNLMSCLPLSTSLITHYLTLLPFAFLDILRLRAQVGYSAGIEMEHLSDVPALQYGVQKLAKISLFRSSATSFCLASGFLLFHSLNFSYSTQWPRFTLQ